MQARSLRQGRRSRRTSFSPSSWKPSISSPIPRARILYALGHQTLCVRDLAIVTGVSESAMSHQLRLLRDRRVVRVRRDGTTMYYSVDDQHVAALLREAEYHADHVRQGLPDHAPYPPAEGGHR